MGSLFDSLAVLGLDVSAQNCDNAKVLNLIYASFVTETRSLSP